MSKQDFSILFWIKRSIARKAKDGKAPISARVTINGLRTEISLSRKVLPEEWDEENKIVISTTPEAKIINKKIAQTKVDLDRHFLTLQAQYLSVTPEMLKNVYEGKAAIPVEPMEQISILEAFDHFINRFEKLVKKGRRSAETLVGRLVQCIVFAVYIIWQEAKHYRLYSRTTIRIRGCYCRQTSMI